MFGAFYQGKSVVITGHTGFKGGWLSLWLKHLGATVWGIALDPPTDPNLYEIIRDFAFEGEIRCDIRRCEDLQTGLQEFQPEIIFHLAAQPLVRQSFVDPLATLEVNALGTAHVMEAVRRSGLSADIVVVTTDKCYENRAWEYGYRENDALGGHDVYSASKAAAEVIAQSWYRSFFLTDPKLRNVATARAGNVIGGGDYAPDRIIPDAIRALLNKQPVAVRNPASTRPWQHVLDCLSGYLWLGAQLASSPKGSVFAGAFNFGPGSEATWTVEALVTEVFKHWKGTWQPETQIDAPKESDHLDLCIDKAIRVLQWRPVWTVEEAVRQTVHWYRERHSHRNPDLIDVSLVAIDAYTADARSENLVWARDL